MVVLGFDRSEIFKTDKDNTCFPDKKRGIYVARTEYNILMHDSKNKNQKWNVTFFDYTSHAMGKEMLNDYGEFTKRYRNHYWCPKPAVDFELRARLNLFYVY